MRYSKLLPWLSPSLLLVAFGAGASPGDTRVIQGVLAWSPGGDSAPFIVVRADDGRNYVADVSAAQRHGERSVNVGDRVSLVGVEGNRPWELSTRAVGLGDSALAASPPPPGAAPTPPGATSQRVTPRTATPAQAVPPRATPPERPADNARPSQRLRGRIDSISGKTVRLRDVEGRNVSVDISQLKGNATTVLRPGDEVTLFVVTEADQRLVAVGFVQADAPPPSASPRGAP
jgi:hypothetical protein